MTKAEKEIYINIRAEVIKHWQDTRNEGKFNGGGFCIKQARKLAEKEMYADLQAGYFRITIDELLLLSLEECCHLIESRNQTFVKLLLSIYDND